MNAIRKPNLLFFGLKVFVLGLFIVLIFGHYFLKQTLGQTGTINPTVMTWVTECVECPRYFDEMSHRSAALDSNNYLHVAYGGDHLYYSNNTSGQWFSEIVDNSPQVGLYATLALDSTDRPHIAYFDGYEKTLKYGHYDGTTWQLELVWTNVISNPYASINVDSSNAPHLSFYDYTSKDLMYAYRDNAGWQITPIDTTGCCPSFSLMNFV